MILDIPRDILVHHIFPFLDLEDVANIQSTCKRLYTIVQEDTLWKNLILKMHHAENFKAAAKFLKEVMNQNAKLEDTIDDQFHQLGRKTRIIKRLEEDLDTMWTKLDIQEQNNRNLESKLRCTEEELRWVLEHHPSEKEALQEELRKTLAELEQTKKNAAFTEAKLREENSEMQRKLEECEMDKKKLERTVVKQQSAMKDLEDEVSEMRKRMKEIIKQNRGLMYQLQKFKQPTDTTAATSMPRASPPTDIPIQKPTPHYPTHIHRVNAPYVPTSTSPPFMASSSSSSSSTSSQTTLQPLPQSTSPPPKTVSPPPSRPVYSPPQLPLKNKY